MNLFQGWMEGHEGSAAIVWWYHHVSSLTTCWEGKDRIGKRMDSSKATVDHMAGLKAIQYDRSSDLEKQEGTILQIVEHCTLNRRPLALDFSSKATSSSVLLLAYTDHYEALSTSMILSLRKSRLLIRETKTKCQNVDLFSMFTTGMSTTRRSTVNRS